MIKRLTDLCLIPLAAIVLTTGTTNSQINTSVSGSSICIKVAEINDSYTMRLDFMTESQVDDIIQSGIVSLDQLCDFTMGCKSRKEVILNANDRIQLFSDSRVKSVELVKMEDGKKTTIAVSTSNSKESYIQVPQEIRRVNLDNYLLLIVK